MDAKSFDDIYEEMRDYLIAHQDKITDFNEGSIINSFLECIAIQINALYIRGRVGFNDYLKSLPYSIFSFSQKTGSKASGIVTFSRATPLAYDTIIPSGTVLKSGSMKFVTTESGTISGGQTVSGQIEVSAEETGTEYNVSAGSINSIESVLPSDIVSVENITKCTGGTDAESDADFLARFQQYTIGLQGTNDYGIKTRVKGIDGVRSCSIIEHFPPTDDIYNMTIYVDDGTGNCPEALMNEVKKVVNGTGTSAYPGCRAPGVNAQILAPTIVPINLEITVTTYNVDNDVAISACKSAITEYINALLVGDDVILTSIILILRRLSYVEDVVITKPTENISISDNQIARAGTCTITVVAE